MVWNKCNCEGKRETEALMASRTATVQLGVTGETQGSASIYSPDAMHIGESRGSHGVVKKTTLHDGLVSLSALINRTTRERTLQYRKRQSEHLTIGNMRV